MIKNVPKAEKAARVVLGILFGFLTFFMGGWPGWARAASGIVALAFFGTALVGY